MGPDVHNKHPRKICAWLMHVLLVKLVTLPGYSPGMKLEGLHPKHMPWGDLTTPLHLNEVGQVILAPLKGHHATAGYR